MSADAASTKIPARHFEVQEPVLPTASGSRLSEDGCE